MIMSFQESDVIDKLKKLEACLIIHIQVCVQRLLYSFLHMIQCSIVTHYSIGFHFVLNGRCSVNDRYITESI